ncbi:MAG: hypothetical protein HC869_27375 [Rhodospirillales bacterium]|nr:hypothetical protein [Rhodospirillales bacterium]
MTALRVLLNKLAALFFLALMFVPFLAAAAIVRGTYQSNAEIIAELQDNYDRLRSIASFDVKSLAQSADRQDMKQLYLGAGATAVLTSELQARLRGFAGQRSVEIMQASELEPSELDGGLTKLGVKLELSGPAKGVHGLLQKVDQSIPWLFADNVQIRSDQVPDDGPARRAAHLREPRSLGCRRIRTQGSSIPMSALVWRSVTLLFVACTAAILVAGYQAWQAPRVAPEERRVLPWNPQVKFEETSPGTSAAENEFDESFARPLFSATRKPFVPIAVAMEPPQPEPPPEMPVAEPATGFDPSQFILKGIWADGEKRRALIATPDNPDGEWSGIGSELSGWIVKEIGLNAIIVSSGEKRVTLQQYVDNSKVPLGMPAGNQ